MERKLIAGFSLKAEAAGKVTAQFGTWDVADLDGDILVRGAIGSQRIRVSTFGHGSWGPGGGLPVGVGTTREGPEGPEADLHFFMDVGSAADHFRVIRGLAEAGLSEWSMGFTVPEGGAGQPTAEQRGAGAKRILRRVEIHEISPVMRGSQPGTRTIDLRCDGCGGAPTAKAAPTVPDGTVRREMVRARVLHRLTERDLKGEPPRPGDPDFRRPADPTAERLAVFVTAVGHKILGRPRDVRAPAVVWFSQKGGTRGFVVPGRHHVHLDVGLRDRELVEIVLHETCHVGQDARGLKLKTAAAEAEAVAFAEQWAGAVSTAYRVSKGQSWRIAHRETRPGWYGDEDKIVLHNGRCWSHNWNAAGNAWSAHA